MRAIYYLLLAVLLLSGCTSVFGQDRIPKQLRKLTSKAEQGNVKAQNTLGKMYYKGEGVPKDYQLAMKWYRKSAVQGHAGAQYYLGQMYKEGHGVREDKVLAHKWFNLAAAQGHKSAAGNRNSLAQHMMTPSQIQEAQRLAKNFKPKKEFKKNKKNIFRA